MRPADWVVRPATVPWPEGTTTGHDPAYHDWFEGPSAEEDFGGVVVASQPVPVAMTTDPWTLDNAERQAASTRDCKGPVDAWYETVVGSLTISRIDLECFDILLSDVAFVVDGTGYVMSGNQVVLALFLDTFVPGA